MTPPLARTFRSLKHVCYTLVLLYVPTPSFAAPIRDSSTASSWLACLTALLVFSLICLSAFKLLFVRHRRINNLKRPSSSLLDSRRRLRLPGFVARITGKDAKAGFLIGLFGSPSFEIRSKPSELTLLYPGIDASKISQNRDLSSDTSASSKSKNSVFSTGPIFFNKKSPWYIHGKGSRSGFHSSASRGKSFFSLPTRLSLDLGRVRRQKKQAQVMNLPQEDLPWPHNRLEHATLRLVKSYTDPDTTLPLSHGLNNMPESSGLGPTLPSHSLIAAYLNYSEPVPLRSLPSLPAKDYLRQEVDGFLGNASFDHPYNNHLLNLVKPGRQKSRRVSLSPNLSLIDEACQNFPDTSYIGYTLPDVCGSAKLPFVLDPIKNLPLAYNACDALRRRERANTKSSSVRNRRSPPLGPSPLRSILFPANVIEEPKCDLDSVLTIERMSVQSQRLSFDLSRFNIHQKRSKDLTGSSSEGRESILDILQELAEETRDWDDSIAMDENFKAMIKRSQKIMGCTSFETVNADPSSKALPPIQTPSKPVSFWAEDSPTP